MLQQAELSRYRAMEERRKWEGREERLEELCAAKAKGSRSVDVVTTTRLVTELRDKTSQLESSEAQKRAIEREGCPETGQPGAAS